MKINTPLLFTLCTFFFLNYSFSQDSLSIKVLEPLTHTFTIEDGRLKGTGADFLRKEIATAQFTMLGEYSDSKRISEFTRALIPEVDELGYKMIVLDIGPIAGNILNRMSKNPDAVVNSLESLNQKYMIKEQGEIYTSIPNFEHEEDALIIKKAGEHGLSIIGIARESFDGLSMLIDEMFTNFSVEDQKKYQNIYEDGRNTLKKYYAERNGDLMKFPATVRESIPVKKFLVAAAAEVKNATIIEAFHYSLVLCEMYAKKQFYDKNILQTKNEKRILRRELEAKGFDINKDKMLLKMDMDDLSKGFQGSTCYGVGNMVNELARYNDQKAFNIGFVKRYHQKEGQLIDQLQDVDDFTTKQLKAIMQMGQTDQWVVIDLRPLISGYYYWPQKYLVDRGIEDLMKRYDVVVIPKTELVPKVNY